MRRIATSVALVTCLGVGIAGAEETVSPDRCAAIGSALGQARSEGRLVDVTRLLAEAGEPSSGCKPQPLFCLGRSAALAHVEAAYAAADAGRPEDAGRLLDAGRAFGVPWPLLVGLGDAASGAARAGHDPSVWAKASLAYQQALEAIKAPALCPGEPAAPDTAAQAAVTDKMTLATLLAAPVSFFHDRCAPCALSFLAHGRIDGAHPRALPITFVEGRAGLTAEGRATAKALAACALALRWPRLTMSVHTDARGSDGFNLALSRRRATALRRAMSDDGFSGLVEVQAAGKRRPLAIADPTGLLPGEIQRANRRVELLAIGQIPADPCRATTP